MASLYRRPRSPFWWIKFRDSSGVLRYESTKLRLDDPVQSRRARDLATDFVAEESERNGDGEQWGAWVRHYLEQRYSAKQYTLGRYLEIWDKLSRFLSESGIRYPRQLNRAALSGPNGYIEWRRSQGVLKNTALHELKVLRLVMFEAVQLGYVKVNPCAKLGIGKDPERQKPRITKEENEKIVAALPNEPEWMQVSYQIAWHQGCRLTETQVPLADIDLARMVIGFRTKGHKVKVAEFPLAEGLVPLTKQLQAAGREVTCKLPKGASKYWTLFFRRIGLPHLSFHCLRVTLVTRAHESGLTMEQAMRLVGHATVVAHQVYPRLRADESSAQALRRLL